MQVVDPGHKFHLQIYRAEEDGRPISYVDTLQFMKRIGAKFPGNFGEPVNGTNCQEVIRALIKRMLYLDQQDSHPRNKQIIARLRVDLLDFEFRAAERRGESLKEISIRIIMWCSDNGRNIEDIAACLVCGHIFCEKHPQPTQTEKL